MTEPVRAAPPAAEEVWLEREIAEADFLCNTGRASIYRRILHRLRVAPDVPDREALARALYAASVSDEKVRPRLEAWDTSSALYDWVREEYLEKVDRLVRVLGGFPAVPQRKPNVMEYDGAYKCFTCGDAWGAVTNPTPCTCVPSPSPDAEMERQMQEVWRKDLEDAVEDAIHTLTNEVRAGTVFNEAGWVHGTLAMLKRVDPSLRKTVTPLFAGQPVDHSQEG